MSALSNNNSNSFTTPSWQALDERPPIERSFRRHPLHDHNLSGIIEDYLNPNEQFPHFLSQMAVSSDRVLQILNESSSDTLNHQLLQTMKKGNRLFTRILASNKLENKPPASALDAALLRTAQDVEENHVSLENGVSGIQGLLESQRFSDLSPESLAIALKFGARHGQIDLVNNLINGLRFQDIKKKELGWALGCAAPQGHLSIVKALLASSRSQEIDQNARDTARASASITGKNDIVDFLDSLNISAGAWMDDKKEP